MPSKFQPPKLKLFSTTSPTEFQIPGRHIQFKSSTPTVLNTLKIEGHSEEIMRLVEILRITIDRRFPPDTVIEHALMQVEREALALVESCKSL